jgi:peptide methionine sulfoxide reductase msrA/msrB
LILQSGQAPAVPIGHGHGQFLPSTEIENWPLKSMKKKFNRLTKEEKHILIDKGTESPFSGKYNDFSESGIYVCKQCNTPLYRSEDKFSSHCGWPSFDDEIPGAIVHKMDVDGRRTEILCANCDGHLGHIFEGERITTKNIRHCVNSISIKFISAQELKTAYFAGGCFWGVEHLMQQLPGVVSVISGYMGGQTENPTYQEVCNKTTGHLEAVEVSYLPDQIDFETLTKFFFEIHDPTQRDGQGPDKGEQYASAIFYHNEREKKIAEKLITILKSKGYDVVTRLLPMSTFWKAEDYHQDYYQKKGTHPYCHRYEKKF